MSKFMYNLINNNKNPIVSNGRKRGKKQEQEQSQLELFHMPNSAKITVYVSYWKCDFRCASLSLYATLFTYFCTPYFTI